MRIWTEAVTKAILRHIAQTGSPQFTRSALIQSQIEAIAADTQTIGVTPTQTLGRILQELRDEGLLAFVDRGTYRWLGPMPDLEPITPSKSVFVLPPHPRPGYVPEHSFPFPAEWLRAASRSIGQWILYQDTGGYHAAARVERVDAEFGHPNQYRARMVNGSYLDFGRAVPLVRHGEVFEQSLLGPAGSLDEGRAGLPIRAIPDVEFDRILELALITDDDVLPRTDAGDEGAVLQGLAMNGAPGKSELTAPRCWSTGRCEPNSSASACWTPMGRDAR